MTALFYASAVVAVIAAVMVVTRANAMHALVNLVVVFLAIASVFYTLGAPFVAALQIVIYAGAIMVLFVFVVMMLNLGGAAEERERGWMSGAVWALPGVLATVLLVLLIAVLAGGRAEQAGVPVGPKAVGISLYTGYFIGVELASVLLLAALVAAFHFGAFLARRGGEDE